MFILLFIKFCSNYTRKKKSKSQVDWNKNKRDHLDSFSLNSSYRSMSSKLISLAKFFNSLNIILINGVFYFMMINIKHLLCWKRLQIDRHRSRSFWRRISIVCWAHFPCLSWWPYESCSHLLSNDLWECYHLKKKKRKRKKNVSNKIICHLIMFNLIKNIVIPNKGFPFSVSRMFEEATLSSVAMRSLRSLTVVSGVTL